MICGEEDALLPRPARRDQVDRYSGSDDVTGAFLTDIGYALTLERSRRELRTRVGAGLGERGF